MIAIMYVVFFFGYIADTLRIFSFFSIAYCFCGSTATYSYNVKEIHESMCTSHRSVSRKYLFLGHVQVKINVFTYKPLVHALCCVHR